VIITGKTAIKGLWEQDIYIYPTSNWKRVKEENVEEYFKPI
jgi:hypothetical protein